MEPLKDYSWLRGVNHGMLDEATTRKYLGYGKRVGLNAVRFWLNPVEWKKDPRKYCEDIRAYIRTCNDCGYKAMPILLNGNGFKAASLEEDQMNQLDEYVTYMVNELKDEDGLLMWDVMNEPAYNPILLEKDISAEERERRLEQIISFLKHYCRLVKELDPKNATTVGHHVARHIEYTANDVDVFSFHDYSWTRESCMNNYALADSIAKKYGKPVIQTETGCLARCNPYDMALEVSQHFNMGWMLFNLMIGGYNNTIHGIFYPDGTVRDPATIAAMFGCFRNRGSSIVVPLPNREGAANRCIDEAKSLLNDYTRENIFNYKASRTEDLLNSCEKMANLLEASDLVPMAYPPTALINRYRAMENPPANEIRKLAFDLAEKLKEACCIL